MDDINGLTLVDLIQETNPDIVKYIWWYDITEDRLEGYAPPNVLSHASSRFHLSVCDNTCAKGRVVMFKKECYLIIHTPGYSGYPEDVVRTLASRFNDLFAIYSVVDEGGQPLLEY